MTEQELREKIAWAIAPYKDRIDICRSIADQILSLIKQAKYVKLSPDQSWHCNGRVFAIGLSPKNFVEMLKGRGFRKVEVYVDTTEKAIIDENRTPEDS